MPSSRRTAAAPPTQRSLPLDAAALLLHAAGTTFGAQPQLPPGFFPHPATPPFQLDRIGRDRRFGPDSAAEISPGRHFVSRDGSDGSGAARERGRSHEVTRRRRFPGVARIVKTTSSTRDGRSLPILPVDILLPPTGLIRSADEESSVCKNPWHKFCIRKETMEAWT
ncbi:hypothetical protein NDU88_004487 [Pleurodeles waltl]|uniref:Uncharacterized protein n=1 Tax=Pleurodeles waltl TaxID=8319 RepID=A0AAV7WS45_PLEWA|nr:hypothetical protein NDU88_004487 [Pleurodeles waltl]